MNPRTHKHYQSHAHVDTPYPVLEHSDTSSSSTSSKSTASFLDAKKHNYTGHTSTLPNPISATAHIIEDHVAEFRFGHAARSAKREARKSSGNSDHRWSRDAAQIRSMSIPESEEVGEEWRESDQKSWEVELEKREAARVRRDMRRDWVGGWASAAEESRR